jgi:RNA ligase
MSLESLIAAGYITRRTHPNLGLHILNYAPKTQYTGNWNEHTERCRGLILDASGRIIANPFPKFFNLGERLELDELPAELPVIAEKLDGFLGVMYPDGDLPAIATRGTFGSPMATWATEWIRSRGYVMADFRDGHTYLFEIIEPALCREHGLLVDYGDRAECVLIAVRHTATGREIEYTDEANRLGLPYAQEFRGTIEDAIKALPSLRGAEAEGFVCRYSDGLRIKLKGDEYKQMHKIVSSLSVTRIHKTIIESGIDGIEEIISGIPDEHYKRVREVVDEIMHKQHNIIEAAFAVYDEVQNISQRSEQAKIIAQHPTCAAVVFAMLDEKDHGMVALKHVKLGGM